MSKIFEDDSESDVEIKTDNQYAKNYDNWRKKEELNKFKTRYGEELLEEDSSSSSEDDEEGVELTEEVEKQFFKTLSCLKNKDPRIYDENINFFGESEKQSNKKKKKEKPIYLNDYERELILNKNGVLSDSEDNEDSRSKSPTYVEEQKKLKESVKKVLNEINEDSDEEWGGMLKVRHKTEEEQKKEEADYKEWLVGQVDKLEDKEAEMELKPLKEYWNNPKLDEDEKFLRDYILQKRFLNKEDDDYIPTYEEIIHDSDEDLSEDESTVQKQEEFEHKYNFRFEEPDQEFIKRYPRSIEQSLRKTDDRRKTKRAETKERKQKEKEEKMQQLKKLQELKRKEIEEKIEKLKEITGNDHIGFNDEDLEGDFDPEAHDRKMQGMFNDDFYKGQEGDVKPVFPELDEYLEIENWAKWEGDAEESENNTDSHPHCEDDDFNMDCDYDPNAETQKELIENTKGKKKRKRKSLFAEALNKPKPIFDPKDKTYEEYLDEYYKLDCEDIVADIPCRFKYRKVVPNDFGLSVEEILSAKDRELNRWCSLKKAVQHRPDHVEKYEQIAYARKAQNLDLKRKILPSLFESEGNEDKDHVVQNNEVLSKKKKKNKKVRCVKGVSEEETETSEKLNLEIQSRQDDAKPEMKNKRKKKKSKAINPEQSGNTQPETKEIKQKSEIIESIEEDKIPHTNGGTTIKKKKKKSKKVQNGVGDTPQNTATKKRKLNRTNEGVINKKRKKREDKTQGISDARLAAYGINPKKFKNKLKYGNS